MCRLSFLIYKQSVNLMNLTKATLLVFSVSILLGLSACETSSAKLKVMAKEQTCSTGCDTARNSCQDDAGMDQIKKSACDLAAQQCQDKC